MEKVVEYIVRALVENKDAVSVKTTTQDDTIIISVSVAKEELGRVVGRGGKNAQAIRTIIHSLAGKEGFSDKKYIIKFEE